MFNLIYPTLLMIQLHLILVYCTYNSNILCRIVATSQMHPTHARKTFPCFDEPAMRAVFYMTLIHARGTVALSNGMEIGQFCHVVRYTDVKEMSHKNF